jgi:hypothetical protein
MATYPRITSEALPYSLDRDVSDLVVTANLAPLYIARNSRKNYFLRNLNIDKFTCYYLFSKD